MKSLRVRKYRARPVEVEAFQVTQEVIEIVRAPGALVTWFGDQLKWRDERIVYAGEKLEKAMREGCNENGFGMLTLCCASVIESVKALARNNASPPPPVATFGDTISQPSPKRQG